jgi:nicotinate-nucleotide adenylyltransferase
MTPRPRVGLLGGTFDPVHNGHLAAALAAEEALALDRVRFIPSARPPHRPDSPRASEYHRVEMMRRAIDGRAGWEVSDLELARDGPSYTIDTLDALGREGFTPLQLFFLIGADAFAEIATWHRYPHVLDAAHFAVVTRPGTSLETLRQRVPSLLSRMSTPGELGLWPTPRIVLIESNTPHVSSTEIRRRVSRNEPLTDLVPPAVAAYIAQEGLYRRDSLSLSGE